MEVKQLLKKQRRQAIYMTSIWSVVLISKLWDFIRIKFDGINFLDWIVLTVCVIAIVFEVIQIARTGKQIKKLA